MYCIIILTWLNENTASLISTYVTFANCVFISRKFVKLYMSSDTRKDQMNVYKKEIKSVYILN